MIDFRYHLVSIVAVFLALAVGLLLGSTDTLQNAQGQFLKDRVDEVTRASEQYRASLTLADRQLNVDAQFAEGTAGLVIPNRLKGESVLFVEVPGSDSKLRTQLDPLVKSAGGSVSGWVTLTEKFLADDQIDVLQELSTTSKPANVVFPAESGAYDKAGQLLAQMLLTKDPAKVGHEETGSGSVFAAFQSAGFLTLSGKPGARATLAVVIAPKQPYDGKVAKSDHEALTSFTVALDQAGRGTLVVGSPVSAESGGFIASLRGNSASATVSTVDNANTSVGEIISVLALDAELIGQSGKYGIASNASNGALPNPLPPVSAVKQ